MSHSQLGLSVLDPPGGDWGQWTREHGRPTVDIVMVHGLNGGSVSTWTKDTVFWPRDLLPHKIPNARVMTFAYNADVVFSSSTNTVRDYATQLLSSLRDKRDEPNETDRPLILICHSLGGIVAKQALLTATIDENYNSIAESTKGVIFFGTPHRGSAVASWGKVAARVAASVGSRKDLIEVLEKKSKVLRDISDDFTRIAANYAIKSFFESNRLGGLAIIVSKDSATMNITQEEKIPIDGDHREMCRFSANDNRFEAVWKAIRRCIPEEGPSVLSEAAVRLLSQLPGHDDDEYLDNDEDLFPGSCDWIFNHSMFREWLSSVRSRVLHICGNPGSGKSVAAAFLFRSYFQSGRNSPVFFFSFQTRRDGSSATAAWGSLIRQQVAFNSSLVSEVLLESELSSKGGLSRPQIWTEGRLRELFQGLARAHRDEAIFVIDALDECDGTIEKFLDSLSSIFKRQAYPWVKILLFSRPILPVALATSFDLGGDILELDFDNEPQQSQQIQAFIEKKVGDLCKRRPGLLPLRSLITTELATRSRGLYLLPSLTLKTLAKIQATTAKIRSAIQHLPSDLLSIYRQALEKVNPDDREVAGVVLLWVVFGTRPLTVSELSTAVAWSCNTSISTLKDLEDQISLDLLGDAGVSELLGPLLKITKGSGGHEVVTLVHSSAREYLVRLGSRIPEQRDGASLPPQWISDVFGSRSVGNESISETQPRRPQQPLASSAAEQLSRHCKGYIDVALRTPEQVSADATPVQPDSGSPLAPSDASATGPRALLRYAVENLPEHAREVEKDNNTFHMDFAEYLFTAEGQEWMKAFWSIKDPGQRHKAQPPLHLCCVLGLVPAVKALLELGFDPETRDADKCTALDVAAMVGHVDVMKALCETAGAKVNVRQKVGSTPLHTAALYGQADAVEYLLFKGAFPSAMDQAHLTPLEVAVRVGSLSVTRLLRPLHPYINNLAPVLERAVSGGELAAIRFVLAHYPEYINSSTLLHMAARHGQIAALELLLDLGANINTLDSNGSRAIHCAASAGNVGVIQCMLDRKVVDINATDRQGRNALYYACISAQNSALPFLAERGIDFDNEDVNGHTVLEKFILGGLELEGSAFLALDSYAVDGLADYKVLATLWKLADVGVRARRGFLHRAIRQNNAAFKYLFDKKFGPKIELETSIAPMTTLLARLEVDLNEQDEQGRTAIHVLLGSSCGYKIQPRLDLLLNAGASVKLTDTQDESPMDTYIQTLTLKMSKSFHDMVVSMLLSHGASLGYYGPVKSLEAMKRLVDDNCWVDAKSVFDSFSKHSILSWLSAKEILLKIDSKLLGFLISQGSSNEELLPTIGNFEQAALEDASWAAIQSAENIDEFGRACIKCLDSTSQGGLLRRAAVPWNSHLFTYLTETLGFAIDTTDSKSRTSLSYAAGYGDKAAVEALIDMNASVESGDDIGLTPLWYALLSSRLEIADILLDHGALLHESVLNLIQRSYPRRGGLAIHFTMRFFKTNELEP